MQRKLDYSIIIVAICFLVIMTSLGLCSSGRTLYLTAITEALNIPRSAFSLNDTVRHITVTILSLFLGKLINKFGEKKLLIAGYVSLIIFALLNSLATNLITFYIASIFLGIGISWCGTTMISTIIHKWCTKNVGTITGTALAANGIGGAIAVQVLSPIIFQEGNPFGYRTSYRLVAIVLAVVLTIILFFFKNKPSDSTDNTVVKKKKKARGEGWSGISYQDGTKKPYFYIIIICIFLTGFTLQGLGGIAVPHMYDVGIDINYVALLTSMGSLLLAVSKFSTGFLYDKTGMRMVMTISLVCALVSVFGLVFLSNTPIGKIIAMVRNILASFALPLETVMLPLYASEFFGNKDFEKFVGVFAAANTAGFAIGAPLGNVFYDVFGSYNMAFIIFGTSMIFVNIAMEISLTYANRDRKEILDKSEA